MGFSWNITLEEELALYVEANPLLWDKRLTLYHRNDLAIDTWDEVGRKLGCKGYMAKKQFSLLRRRYAHYKKTLKAKGTKSPKVPNELFDKLKFLDPVMECRIRSVYDCNQGQIQTASDTESSIFEPMIAVESIKQSPSQIPVHAIQKTESEVFDPCSFSSSLSASPQFQRNGHPPKIESIDPLLDPNDQVLANNIALMISQRKGINYQIVPTESNMAFCNLMYSWLVTMSPDDADQFKDDILEKYLIFKRSRRERN